MKRSKDTFLELQQFEAMPQYPHDFTRKKAKEYGKESAQKILDSGNLNIHKEVVQAARIKTVVDSYEAEIRQYANENIQEPTIENGCKITKSSVGDRLDFEQDPIYKQLYDDLKEREEILKLAYKSKGKFYDEEGILVPKVGIKTHGKETIKLSF